jgi:hypothetical protein
MLTLGRQTGEASQHPALVGTLAASTDHHPRGTWSTPPNAAMNPLPFTTLACLASLMIIGWLIAAFIL